MAADWQKLGRPCENPVATDSGAALATIESRYGAITGDDLSQTLLARVSLVGKTSAAQANIESLIPKRPMLRIGDPRRRRAIARDCVYVGL